MVNKAIILGRVTRDPELSYTPSQVAVCKLGLATNETWKDKSGQKQERAEFHRIVVFGKQAEIVSQYVAKGREIYVEGKIQTSSYEKDGVKHYSTEINADRVQFIGSKASNTNSKPVKEFKGGDSQVVEQNGFTADEIPF